MLAEVLLGEKCIFADFMGTILQYIENNNASIFLCYNTKKTSLDDNSSDTITPDNSDTDTTPLDTKDAFAEDNLQREHTVKKLTR